MSPRTIIVVVLALVFGLVAALLVHQLVIKPPAVETVEEEPVVEAIADITPGKEIVAEMLTTKMHPATRRPPGSFKEIKEVLERAAKLEILAGEPVVEGRLTKKGELGLAALVPPGWRAYSIPVVDVAAGISGFIMPRAKVDVLLTLRGAGNEKEGGPITNILLQNVEVLAVGSELAAIQGARSEQADKLRTVTLLVKPGDANKLQLGASQGTLHLVLRNPTDKDDANAESATMAMIRQGGTGVTSTDGVWKEQLESDRIAMDKKFTEMEGRMLKMINENKGSSDPLAPGGLLKPGEVPQSPIILLRGSDSQWMGVTVKKKTDR